MFQLQYFVFESRVCLEDLLKKNLRLAVIRETGFLKKNEIIGELNVNLSSVWRQNRKFECVNDGSNLKSFLRRVRSRFCHEMGSSGENWRRQQERHRRLSAAGFDDCDAERIADSDRAAVVQRRHHRRVRFSIFPNFPSGFDSLPGI